ALERGSRLRVDAPLHGEVQEAHLDQPVPQAHLGLHRLHRAGPRADQRPDVPADPAGSGRGHALSVQVGWSPLLFGAVPVGFSAPSGGPRSALIARVGAFPAAVRIGRLIGGQGCILTALRLPIRPRGIPRPPSPARPAAACAAPSAASPLPAWPACTPAWPRRPRPVTAPGRDRPSGACAPPATSGSTGRWPWR